MMSSRTYTLFGFFLLIITGFVLMAGSAQAIISMDLPDKTAYTDEEFVFDTSNHISSSTEISKEDGSSSSDEVTFAGPVSSSPGTFSGDVTYSLVSAPDDMVIDQDTGVISGWTPQQETTETIKVLASDNIDSKTDSFDVTVIEKSPEMDLDTSSIMIGGETAERDTAHTAEIEVTNTGSIRITSLDVAVNDMQGDTLGSEYDVSTSISSSSPLSPGESRTVSVTMTIPDDASVKKQNVARVEIEGKTEDETMTEQVYVRMQAEPVFTIDTVEIERGDSATTVADGDTVNVDVGDEVLVKTTLHNGYLSGEALEEAYVQLEDMGDWDIAEQSVKETVAADSEATLEMNFTIPGNVDDEQVSFFMGAYADESDDTYDHQANMSFALTLNRSSHELLIDSWSFSENPVDCTEDGVDLDVTLKNAGKNDEDDVMLSVMSKPEELDWHTRERDITVDKGEMKTVTVHIPVSGDVAEDSYFIKLKAFRDSNELSEDETIGLDVTCDGMTSVNDDNDDNDGAQGVTTTISGDSVTQTRNDDESAQDADASADTIPNSVEGQEKGFIPSDIDSEDPVTIFLSSMVAIGVLGSLGYLVYNIVIIKN